VRIVAHRTCPLDAPENSLAGIAAASRLGADAVEIDVRRTVTGAVVLGPDATYWRVARSPVPAFLTITPWRRRLRLPDGTPPPTLTDVLAILPDGLDLAIDAKASTAVAPAVALLAGAGLLGRAAFWVRRERAVAEVARLAPACERALLADAATSAAAVAYIERAVACGATAVSLHHRTVDGAVVDLAHRRGLIVYAWVTHADSHEDVFATGVDGVVTDWPELARRLAG
jgi:glycerophosphoryl diester phosphodiesterase